MWIGDKTMALPKASIANSASFQISGTPFVHEETTASAKTINFKYVTRAITINCGVESTISFGATTADADEQFTVLANQTYRFEVKTKKIIVTPDSSGRISINAELTSVESGQLSAHVQDDWATVT